MPDITYAPPRLNETALQTSIPTGSGKDIDRKANEFESILLTQWLQSAETSFGSVPGADEGEDATGQQWGGFAMQQLAKAISDKGGIGIGHLVSQALRHTEKGETPPVQGPHNNIVSR